MDIPFNRPTLPPYSLFNKGVKASYDSGMITNGPVVRQLEDAIQDTFRVDNAVAVSCCTNGLMLALRCLGLCGKVVLPSFTFFALAHAVVWNGLEPVFVDVEPDNWNMSPAALERALEKDSAISAVMPVHVFGNPCDVDTLENLVSERALSLIYDSAHAMGARVGNRWVGGFGDAEVFSLSPTKIVVAGEGGVLTTNDEKLAMSLRAGRDYGNTGDYDPSFFGLNARMSEFHAALAVESFRMLDENVRRRNAIADRYKEELSALPGVTFQAIRQGNRSTFKDFTVLIDEERLGLSRDALAWHLSKKGIDSRRYYYPPVHRTTAYWERWGHKYDELLPVTNRLSEQALSLPIWSHMELNLVDMIIEAIQGAHERADSIKKEYSRDNPK
ncbi:MAG: DegT/DnrJ/EryC1/StrS family aminotransferase [Actinobacteria bacterium]|nr:DegT/DnrJ/EryC1/StrS family aminotransferase [Actinomycetota bacterium]